MKYLRQFEQRFVAIERRSRRHPLVEKRIRELLPSARAAANKPLQLRLPKQTAKSLLSRYINSCAFENTRQLRAHEVLPLPERPLECSAAPTEYRVVELQRPVVVGHYGVHTGRGERQHPANVSRRDEVPCWTENVSAYDRPIDQCSFNRLIRGSTSALRYSPLGTRVILRLNRAKPGYDFGWVLERATNQMLVGRVAPTSDLRQIHAVLAVEVEPSSEFPTEKQEAHRDAHEHRAERQVPNPVQLETRPVREYQRRNRYKHDAQR